MFGLACCCNEEGDKRDEIKPIPVNAVWQNQSVLPDQDRVPVGSSKLPSGLLGETVKKPVEEPRPTAPSSPPPSALHKAPEAATPEKAPEQVPEAQAEEKPYESQAKSVGGGEPFFFDVHVDLSDAELGMKLYVMPSSISISTVKTGAVSRYNMGASGAYQVRQNDFIAAVNGRTSVSEMVEALKSKDSMTLRICRPATFSVTLDKKNKILGCRINAMPGHSLIYVSEIMGGATALYNSSAPTDQQIKVHDCFVAVNGAFADVDAMVAEFQNSSASSLRLTVARPPPSSS